MSTTFSQVPEISLIAKKGDAAYYTGKGFLSGRGDYRGVGFFFVMGFILRIRSH